MKQHVLLFSRAGHWRKLMASFHKISSVEFKQGLRNIPSEVIRVSSIKGFSPFFIINKQTKEYPEKLSQWVRYCHHHQIPLDVQVKTSKFYHKNYCNTAIHELLANEHFDVTNQALDNINKYNANFDFSKQDSEGKTPFMLGLLVGALPPLCS